jgi:MYXO-CTERM domain-containing protein
VTLAVMGCHRQAIKRLFGLGAALTCLAVPAPASANGRFPAAGQLALDPADPDVLLVRATYGLLLTRDDATHWSWICEDTVGYGGFEDPMMSFTADGSILAATFEGLGVSHDTGCDWAFAGGGLAGQYVVDLDMEKGDPSKGVLLVANDAGQEGGTPVYVMQLWETSDSGATWAQAGTSLPASFFGVTVDTAPSDSSRIYASGTLGPPGYPAHPGLIERSDDGGATWQPMFIPGSDDANVPYIGAVDPQNPDVLYVRLDGNPTDQLVVSEDGGATWTKVFETRVPPQGATSPLLGLALSPDGSTVALGGPNDGLWTAPASTLTYTKASSMSALCLTWSAAGLYGCGDEVADGFTAGISTDQGKTWTPLLHRAGLCGPLACAADSGVATQCNSLWPLNASAYGDPSCDGMANSGPSPDASGGGDSGSSTSGSSTSGSSTSGAGGGGGDSACACALAGATSAELPAMATALLGAGALAARRRRRR